MQKAQRRRFKHWLYGVFNQLPILEDDERIELFRKMKVGDKQAKERLIIGHIRFACSIVARFCTSHYYQSDDLMSVALEAVTDGIELIEQGAIDHHETPNISGYLHMTILGRLKNFIRENHVLRPARTAIQRGKAKAFTKVADFNDEGAADDNLSVAELNEILEKAIKNDKERHVINLIKQGFTQREISKQMNCSFQWVNKLRTDVFNRVRELCSK